MKKSWIYTLIAILTIGASTAIASALPTKEKKDPEVQYDFNSIEEFEAYVHENIEKENAPLRSEFDARFAEVLASEPLTVDSPQNEDIFLNSSGMYFPGEGGLSGTLYRDGDVMFSTLNAAFSIGFMVSDEVMVYLVLNDDGTYVLGNYDSSGVTIEGITKLDVFEEYMLVVCAIITGSSSDYYRNETCKTGNFEIGKVKFQSLVYECEESYEQDENGSPINYVKHMGASFILNDLKIDCSDRKITIPESKFNELNTELSAGQCSLNAHQLFYLNIVKDGE